MTQYWPVTELPSPHHSDSWECHQRDVHLYTLRGKLNIYIALVGVWSYTEIIRILGRDAAVRLLEQGWKASATEANNIGLVSEVVEHEKLQNRAQVSDGSFMKMLMKLKWCTLDTWGRVG